MINKERIERFYPIWKKFYNACLHFWFLGVGYTLGFAVSGIYPFGIGLFCTVIFVGILVLFGFIIEKIMGKPIDFLVEFLFKKKFKSNIPRD